MNSKEEVPRQEDSGPVGTKEQEEETFDSVTQLQEELALLCENLFVGIGSLQRDAPPRSLQGEDVVTAPGQPAGVSDVDAAATAMGKKLGQSLSAVKKCIEDLPDDVISRPGSQNYSDDELERLMRVNDGLDGDIAKALETAQHHAEKLGAIHGAIVEALLSKK